MHVLLNTIFTIVLLWSFASCNSRISDDELFANETGLNTENIYNFSRRCIYAKKNIRSKTPIITEDELSIILIEMKLHFLLNVDLKDELEIAYIKMMNLVKHADSLYQNRLLQKFPILIKFRNEFDEIRLKKIVMKYHKKFVRRDNYFFEDIDVHYGWRNAKNNSLFVAIDTMTFEHAFPKGIELKADFPLN